MQNFFFKMPDDHRGRGVKMGEVEEGGGNPMLLFLRGGSLSKAD